MLRLELALLLASGRKIADTGLSRERAEETDNQTMNRRSLTRALRRLQKHIKQLEHLGIIATENVDHDPDRPDKDFLFSGRRKATRAVARSAFAAGVYSRLLDEEMKGWATAIYKVIKGKKAGLRGGEAKAAEAAPRRQETWKAYVQWANKPANESMSDAKFCEWFAEKKKKSKGFSRGTIHRAIKELRDRILERTRNLAMPDASRRKRAELVAQDMAGEPGISLATVQRALS